MKKPRGYICCDVPMICTSTRKPSRNLIVRYRQCYTCGSKIITEERISKDRKPIHPKTGKPAEGNTD